MTAKGASSYKPVLAACSRSQCQDLHRGLLWIGVDRQRRDHGTLAAAAIPIVLGMSARLGRFIAAESHRFGGPLGLTAVAMAVGSAATLVLAVVSEGVAIFSPRVRLLIVWIAAVNTALAYTLWAQSQRTLRAVESSVLGDLTTIQVAAIGWLVLGEGLTLAQLVGLLLVLFGVALVQISPALYRRYAPDIAA